MARTPSSARRKRRQHALASPRPARAAHQDARPEESFCSTLSTKGPGVSGKIKMEWHGSSLSLIAKAVAMLILVTAACLAAIAITVACKLAAVTAGRLPCRPDRRHDRFLPPGHPSAWARPSPVSATATLTSYSPRFATLPDDSSPP
jgi:hypothetical protein